MEVSAVIVARGGSVRIGRKSMLKLNGETLIERKIRQLKECSKISRVIFGSDDLEMLETAKRSGAEVFRRPDFFCDESKASANDMIANMLSFFSTDIVVWAHCTNPLIDFGIYGDAIEVFQKHYKLGVVDSLLSVVELREHIWASCHTDGMQSGGVLFPSSVVMNPINYDPYLPVHTPASRIDPYYIQDGGIFIQPYEQMVKNRYFFGRKPLLYQIPHKNFLDINTWRDYLLASAILSGE